MATRQHGEPLSLSSMLKSSVLVSRMLGGSELLSPLYVFVFLSKIKYCFHKYGLIFDYCITLVSVKMNVLLESLGEPSRTSSLLI